METWSEKTAKRRRRAPSNLDTTNRSTVANNVNVEKKLDHFVVCEELRRNTHQVEIVEDYESKTHHPMRGDVRLQCLDQWRNMFLSVARSKEQHVDGKRKIAKQE